MTVIKVIALIKKLPDMDASAFQEYYEKHHAPLINKLLPFYQIYRRNYLDHGVRPGQPNPGFDVVTELVFASQSDYDGWQEALKNPEIISQIRHDESHFVQSGETRMWVVVECSDEVGRTAL